MNTWKPRRSSMLIKVVLVCLVSALVGPVVVAASYLFFK